MMRYDRTRMIERAKVLSWNVGGAVFALVPVLALMLHERAVPFLASVGGSTIFVFALSQSPAAQPRALFVGHLSSAAIGILCFKLLGPDVFSMVVALSLTMLAMIGTRSIHPPAGANALLMIHAGAGWSALLMPVATSIALLIVVAMAWSRFRPGDRYPSSWYAASSAG